MIWCVYICIYVTFVLHCGALTRYLLSHCKQQHVFTFNTKVLESSYIKSTLHSPTVLNPPGLQENPMTLPKKNPYIYIYIYSLPNSGL